MGRYEEWGLYIDGQWRPASDGGTFAVVNPATEEVIGEAPQASSDDTLAAIEVATRSFGEWSRTNPWSRSTLLRSVASHLKTDAQSIALWITLETGKPLGQAVGEVMTAAEYFDWFADEARRILGQTIPARERGARLMVSKEPVGPVAVLTSWNFPVNLPARKIAAALAAGCTVICRPSEEAPGSTMALFSCLAKAGFPAGVVNLLTGHHGPIMPPLMADARIRKISFTGSTAVGKHLIEQSAASVKRTSMELGGHASAIVFDDADVEKCAVDLATFKFRNAGQICISPSRFFVHEAVHDRFVETLVTKVRELRLGNGLDEGVDVGPLINERRLEATESLTQSTLASGATLLAGGRRPPHLNRGYFFEPTVFDQVPDDALVMNEEPFGPIVPIATFTRTAEVFDRANRLEYGLANYVFTRSLSRAHEAIEALQSGMIGVNTALVATVEAPFGGVKQSGFGTEGGSLGIDEYLTSKFAKVLLPDVV